MNGQIYKTPKALRVLSFTNSVGHLHLLNIICGFGCKITKKNGKQQPFSVVFIFYNQKRLYFKFTTKKGCIKLRKISKVSFFKFIVLKNNYLFSPHTCGRLIWNGATLLSHLHGSTMSSTDFHFSVRNGKRWFLPVISAPIS